MIFNTHSVLSKFQGVLFDFDGVVMQTLEDNLDAWNHAISNYNISMDLEQYAKLEGLTPSDLVLFLNGKFKKEKLPVSQIIMAKEDYYRKNAKPKLIPDVEGFINLLYSKKYKLGLVSGARRNRIEETLPKQLLKNFSVIIAAEDINKGKPDPEPYLKGCHALMLKLSQVCVIENAPLGIQSAKKGGFYCIALTSTLKRNFLESADLIIDHFSQLL